MAVDFFPAASGGTPDDNSVTTTKILDATILLADLAGEAVPAQTLPAAKALATGLDYNTTTTGAKTIATAAQVRTVVGGRSLMMQYVQEAADVCGDVSSWVTYDECDKDCVTRFIYPVSVSGGSEVRSVALVPNTYDIASGAGANGWGGFIGDSIIWGPLNGGGGTRAYVAAKIKMLTNSTPAENLVHIGSCSSSLSSPFTQKLFGVGICGTTQLAGGSDTRFGLLFGNSGAYTQVVAGAVVDTTNEYILVGYIPASGIPTFRLDTLTGSPQTSVAGTPATGATTNLPTGATLPLIGVRNKATAATQVFALDWFVFGGNSL